MPYNQWISLVQMASALVGDSTFHGKVLQPRVEDHIRTLRGYQEELHNLRQKIENEEFSIILLTSLPDSWNNYISSIDTSALTNAPQLIARILEHDRRLKIQRPMTPP